MTFYQILSMICFMGFIFNCACLGYIHMNFKVPESLYRYMFMSFFKNIIGAIVQLYIATGNDCMAPWYLKAFPIAVFIASFTFCIDIIKISKKKYKEHEESHF